MSWIAVAVVGTGLATTAINADASRKSANQQADAAKAATDKTDEQYWQTRADLEPFRKIELEGAKIGIDSMKKLQGQVDKGPGQFKESDSYKWTLGQGIKALDKSAVSRGVSRNADTINYAEGLASGEIDNFLRRYRESLTPLQSLSRVQTGSNAQQAGANQAYAGQVGQTIQNAGDASATGTINTANSITGGVNSALNNYMMWKYLNG